jgi:hypothetical protein
MEQKVNQGSRSGCSKLPEFPIHYSSTLYQIKYMYVDSIFYLYRCQESVSVFVCCIHKVFVSDVQHGRLYSSRPLAI